MDSTVTEQNSGMKILKVGNRIIKLDEIIGIEGPFYQPMSLSNKEHYLICIISKGGFEFKLRVNKEIKDNNSSLASYAWDTKELIYRHWIKHLGVNENEIIEINNYEIKT